MTQKKPDSHPNLIPLRWPGEPGRSSIRSPEGFKESLDNLVKLLRDRLGVSINRNALIMRAIQYFLYYLKQAETEKDLIKRLNLNEQIELAKYREELRSGLLHPEE